MCRDYWLWGRATCEQRRPHVHGAHGRAAEGARLRGDGRGQVAHQEAGQELSAGARLGGGGGAQRHRLRSCGRRIHSEAGHAGGGERRQLLRRALSNSTELPAVVTSAAAIL